MNMDQSQAGTVIEQLYLAIENNELELPVMPDSAIKIQRLLDDINVSASQIVAAVASDPVVAAQLIKTANSAAYMDKPKVDSVMAAVSRLGFKLLRNLVITISMARLSNTNHPAIKKYLAEFWKHSREVAAVSYVLAKSQKHLNPDQAMLAGLVHDIGTLPVCLHAEKIIPDLDDELLDSLTKKFGAKVGEKLLQTWEFPPELIEVVIAHEDLLRETDNPRASYADIVTVANMLNRESAKIIKWDNIAAVKRLWLSAETCQTFFDVFDKELSVARDILS